MGCVCAAGYVYFLQEDHGFQRGQRWAYLGGGVGAEWWGRKEVSYDWYDINKSVNILSRG
jgi:hypothetical protein